MYCCFYHFLCCLEICSCIIKELYPNARLIILVVPTKFSSSKRGISSVFFYREKKFLEKENIIVIDAQSLTNKDLMDEKYYLEDKEHPNSEYWNSIIFNFIKTLGL